MLTITVQKYKELLSPVYKDKTEMHFYLFFIIDVILYTFLFDVNK